MEVRQNWFGGGQPLNWKPARTTIGAGADGTINITIDSIDQDEADGYTVEVVEGAGVETPMSATLTGKDIEVTLGTNDGGALDPTLNAELINRDCKFRSYSILVLIPLALLLKMILQICN